jgi:bifunctional DNase/RNase
MEIEMIVKGLMIDPITNMPIIILRDRQGQKVLPIWVGVFEANAIALQIENVQTPRPMTHDLLKNVLDDLQAEVERVVVCATQSPIFVEDAVIQSARSAESSKESMDLGRIQKWLEGLTEEELGKYKM